MAARQQNFSTATKVATPTTVATSYAAVVGRNTNSFKKINSIFDSKDVKLFVKKHPIASRIRRRVEQFIVHDAARELLEIRSRTTIDGGCTLSKKHESGDVEWILELYHTIGYTCVTRNEILIEAGIIERSRGGDPTRNQRKRLREELQRELEEEHYYDKEREVEEDNVVGVKQYEIAVASRPKPVRTSPVVDENQPEKIIQQSDPIASNLLELTQCNTIMDSDESNNDALFESDLTNFMSHGAKALEWPTGAIDTLLPVERTKRNRGGRPKGSVKGTGKAKKPKKDAATVATLKLVSELTKKVVQRVMIEQVKSKSEDGKERLPKGTLQKIIQDVEIEAGMPPNTINHKTVQSRIKSKNIEAKTNLPILSPIEPVLFKYTVQLAKIGQALDKDQVISIAQSLMKQHNLYRQIVEMKRRKKWVDDDVDDEQAAALGATWFTAFMRRKKEAIMAESGVAMRYVSRHFNLRIEHFQNMYDLVYDSLVSAKVAEKFVRPVMFDIDGKRIQVDEREHTYGLPTQYRMTKPEYFLYVDQLGYCDRNVHEIGNYYNHVDGQSFIVNVEDRLGEVIGMKFSVYCFCDGTGTAVLCAVVFMTDKSIDELPLSVRYGIDVTKSLHGKGSTEEELFKHNNGPGEAMQGGPQSRASNKPISCFVGTSTNGLLTSDILLGICTYLDKLEIYDRSDGKKPCLLLDGHGCVLEKSFLDYINSDTNEWVICCGLHKDTHLLNLANSKEMNKSFRDELEDAKARLLASRCVGQRRLYSSDIIPLINEAWDSTLGLSQSCKRALSIRGWNPMNFALLIHPILILRENAPPGKQIRVHPR